MKRVFGKQVRYLIDFYHVCEYLGGAAEHSWASQKDVWLKEQQKLLKDNRHKEVLETICRRLPIGWEMKKAYKFQGKPKDLMMAEQKKEEEETPVEKCYRYIANREDCLDYKTAIEEDLPIGSGEIESSHRYVIQKRLKIAGAWWKSETVEHMLSLRTLRANGDWNRYWDRRKAA